MLTNAQNIQSDSSRIKPETPVSETETIVPRWGARLSCGAQPGVTAEWLQRVAECRMAQVASASMPATQSPLDVKGASVSVQSAGDGFAVDITSSDPKIGREVLSRAQALSPRAAAKQ